MNIRHAAFRRGAVTLKSFLSDADKEAKEEPGTVNIQRVHRVPSPPPLHPARTNTGSAPVSLIK